MNNRGKDWHILHSLRAEALRRPGLDGLGPAAREAAIFAYILGGMPIFHCPGERLTGDFGWRPEDEDALESRFPKPAPAPSAPACNVPEARLHIDFHCFGGYSPAHTCIDYANLLRLGLDGIIVEIQAAGNDEYRQAMIAAVQALQHLIERYAHLLVATTGEQELAETCSRLGHARPRTFQEALQLVWFAHLAIGISEGSDASISLGRFDQYALPFYRQSLADGISETELEQQFAALVDKLNRYGDAACALNLGGLDGADRDQCNDLTRLVIRVCKAKLKPNTV